MASCGSNGLPPVVGPTCTAHTYVVFYGTGLVEMVGVLRRDDIRTAGLLGGRRWGGVWWIEGERVVMTNGFGSPSSFREELPLAQCSEDEFAGVVAATWAIDTIGGIEIDPCTRTDPAMEDALLRLAGEGETEGEVFFTY